MKQSFQIALSFVLIAGCGGDITKDGTPANSGANSGPGLNSSTTSTGHTEMGSPDATVIDAYNRILPLYCAYDATCTEPLLGDACPTPQVPNGQLEGQCWVVDSAALTQCESALRGAQCQGQWENFPADCYTAVRQCACLDGYVAGFDDNGGQACFAPCDEQGQCSGALACYDGACMPQQEGRCPDGQTTYFVDDQELCYDECWDGQECDTGFTCDGFACTPDEG